MSKKNKAKLLPPTVAAVSGELALKLLASLEALAEYDTYETEYDGQMMTMCHSCSSLETGDHHTGCDFIKAKKLIAEAYARAAIEAATLAAPQWLPIADGLPAPMVDVLCLAKQMTTGEFEIKQSCVNPVGTGFYVEYDEVGNAPIEEVTHWQPLPLPPTATPQGNQ